MTHTWISIIAILLALLALFLGVWWADRKSHAPPEVKRKALHLGCGMILLLYPFVFNSIWPVMTVTATALCALFLLRSHPVLRGNLGRIVYGVNRKTFGDAWLFVAAAMLFVLADGDVVLFTIPLLNLTLADSAAALVGVHFGHTHGNPTRNHKSIQGSLAFLIVAVVVAVGVLLLATDLSMVSTLFTACVAAAVATLAERIDWRGIDNITVPLSSWLCLSWLL